MIAKNGRVHLDACLQARDGRRGGDHYCAGGLFKRQSRPTIITGYKPGFTIFLHVDFAGRSSNARLKVREDSA